VQNVERVRSSIVSLPSGDRLSASRALKHPTVRLADLASRRQVALEIDPRDATIDVASVETEFKYEGYLRRQAIVVDRQRRQESRPIPRDFVFSGIPGLSREMVDRLSQIRPTTLGQAARIPGVTPAAVALVGTHIDRRRTGSPNET
jgi:tRNA uridine 5-carboxymethylaminomethyl modification enzyme